MHSQRRIRLESGTAGGESPVSERHLHEGSILSRAGSETPRPKRPAPSGKAKHDQETDSATVP